MNLFNLFAKITLDTEEYDKGLNNASKQASSFSSKIGTAFKTGAKAVTAFIAVVAAATTAIAKLVSTSVSYGDEIDKESQKLNLTTDEYQKWSYILQLCGSDVSTLTTAIRNLTTFTEELTEGDSENLLALQQLGIAYDDFLNMSYSDKLETVIEALQEMEDVTERNTLAQDIFGRSYQELLPLLNQSSSFIDETTASMEELGLIISSDVTTAAAELNDQWTTLITLAKSAGYTLLSELYPAIGEIVDGLTGMINGTDGAVDSIANGLSTLLNRVIEFIPDLLDVLANVLLELINGIVSLLPTLLPAIVNVLVEIIEAIVDIIPDLLVNLWDVVLALFEAIETLDWGKLIISLLEMLLDIVINKLPQMLANTISTVIDIFISVFDLSKIGEFGIMLAQTLVNGIISGIEAGLNLVINAINKLLSGITTVLSWVGIDANWAIPEVSIPRVSWYADGGILEEGTAYAVAGEAGAEIVAQGRNGTGVLNVEQFTEAMVAALDEYGIADIIGNATEACVNGILAGISAGSTNNTGTSEMTVKIGDTAFKAYVIDTVNTQLKVQGRKSLNKVTAY